MSRLLWYNRLRSSAPPSIESLCGSRENEGRNKCTCRIENALVRAAFVLQVVLVPDVVKIVYVYGMDVRVKTLPAVHYE